ncbi:MAG TPA: hypothetical protein PLD54_01375 [Candidatus Levybacteria bacterium]|nr:hypothetical protein [Candidatus Levybacteria bacterium]
MVARIIFVSILLLLLLIESTLISYPFVFILIFLLFMRYQTISTLIIVLVVSIMLDALRVIPVGTTAIFSFAVFFVLFLYNRSIKLGEMILLFVAGFLTTLVYSYIAQYPINLVLHFLVFAALFVVAYTVHQKTHKKSSSSYNPFIA